MHRIRNEYIILNKTTTPAKMRSVRCSFWSISTFFVFVCALIYDFLYSFSIRAIWCVDRLLKSVRILPATCVSFVWVRWPALRLSWGCFAPRLWFCAILALWQPLPKQSQHCSCLPVLRHAGPLLPCACCDVFCVPHLGFPLKGGVLLPGCPLPLPRAQLSFPSITPHDNNLPLSPAGSSRSVGTTFVILCAGPLCCLVTLLYHPQPSNSHSTLLRHGT